MSHANRKLRKKLAKMRAKNQLPPILASGLEKRPIYFSFEGAESLQALLKKYDPQNPLIQRCQEVMESAAEDIERLRAIEEREKSNAYWEVTRREIELKEKWARVAADKRLREEEKQRRRNHRQSDSDVDAAPPSEMKKLIDDGVVEANGDLGQQVNQPPVLHSEKNSGTGSTVLENKPEKFGVPERNG